ncbi:hypothetical protein Rhal01_03399 [Rubritalea halochordaticola]|uniref:Uncharacterized protein n=1 Tax=Rubritalea halochordaticola TaxID=714537 RepID=A0ABP9V3H7_9BACT
MRILKLILLLLPYIAVANPDGEVMRDPNSKVRWSLQQPLYGKLRFVPDKITKLRAEPTTWFGPDTKFKSFSLNQTSSTSSDRKPPIKNLGISIVGEGGRLSGSGEMVRLFDAEYPGTECEITFYQPPGQLKVDQSYLAATVVGKNSRTNWKVYIRFSTDNTVTSEQGAAPKP